MKRYSFALCFLLSACASYPKIGILFAAQPDVLNSVALRQNWNDLIAQHNRMEKLHPVVIRSSRLETGKFYYYLYAEAMDGSLKMAQLLKREDRYLTVNDTLLPIVVCDCEEERPILLESGWMCLTLEGTEGCNAKFWNVDYSSKIFR